MKDMDTLESGFMVDVAIPPECMDDEGECSHSNRPIKQEQNPV